MVKGILTISEQQLQTWAKFIRLNKNVATYRKVKEIFYGERFNNSTDFEIYLQGSVANSTNIWADGDIDIVLQFNNTFYSNDKLNTYYSPSNYTQQCFRSEIKSILESKNIQFSEKNKCIELYLPEQYWQNVDLIPCFKYKQYSRFNSHDYFEGIKINTKQGQIFFICFVLSFVLIYCFKKLLNQYIENDFFLLMVLLTMNLLISRYFLFSFIAKIFFKIPIVKKRIINFNGLWTGEATSSYKKKKFKVKIEIIQTLEDISINAFFNESQSEIISCCMKKESNKEKLIYNYYNQPSNISKLDKHYGTMILEKLNSNQLEGSYFTDRCPQTKGYFVLQKKTNYV